MQTIFFVRPQREAEGEMPEEVHKGLHSINALKVTNDCLKAIFVT